MLTPVDLPSLKSIRNRWAVAAAVYALNCSDSDIRVRSEGSTWHYDDHGGNWATLTRLEGDNAVFVGNAQEHSTEVPDSLLVEGLPDWAKAGLPDSPYPGIRFLYAYMEYRWWRSPYDTEDEFSHLRCPGVGDMELKSYISDHVGNGFAEELADEDDETDYYHVDAKALNAAIESGPSLTRDQLLALVRFPQMDLDRGIAAAAAFA